MTFKFNWENITRYSSGSPFKSIEALKNTFYKKDLTAYKMMLFSKGGSYLLNPEKILNDTITDPIFIYQYLSLAAKRDYSFYKLYGVKSLPLDYYPDLNLGSIRHNPLLNVTKTEIKFQYEEN